MTDMAQEPNSGLQFSLPPDAALYKGQSPKINLRRGLTTLVGPNAAGKTSFLKRLRDVLRKAPPSAGKFVVFLSAGRGSSLEHFRSGSDSPGTGNQSPAAVGHMNYMQNWWQIEGTPGIFMRLKERADLLLKVEARLQTLHQRRLRLEWNQNGLQIKFVSTAGGEPYFANTEASGLLQLIPLLAAIYDDQICALLIDEPEISLHPQLQAFLLQEMRRAAGHPSSGKKFIVIATHSPSMLPMRRIADITDFVFFTDRETLPLQVPLDAGVLKNRKLGALIARLSENHKLAFFASTVLLVEGPSDEIVVGGLSHKLEHPLLSANTQIVPVTGKGEFAETIKLFRLMGKRVSIMADLDGLSDSNSIALLFREQAADTVFRLGHKDLASLDSGTRNELSKLINEDWEGIQGLAEAHRYWTDLSSDVPVEIRKKRSVLAVLLSSNDDALRGLALREKWLALRERYRALLNALDASGCIFLRRGTIEDYYVAAAARSDSSKPEAAAIEVDKLEDMDPNAVEVTYSDAVRALKIAAPRKEINENDLLREQLGSLLGAALQIVTAGMPDDELNSRAASNSATERPVFQFANKTQANSSNASARRIAVSIRSPLFSRPTFPFEIGERENQALTIREKLP